MSIVDPAPGGGVKVKVIRAWNKLAPKLIAFLATGLSASSIIAIADEYFDVTLPLGLTGLIVTIVSTVAGYLKADTAEIPPTLLERGGV